MDDPIKTKVGAVSAYLDAVAHGYTGTREQFGRDLANGANYAKTAREEAQKAEGARIDAESAKTDAETALNGATIAKNAAEAAQSSAENAESNAETASQSASASAVSANSAKTSAQTAATAAQTAATQAQAVLDSIPDDYTDLSSEVRLLSYSNSNYKYYLGSVEMSEIGGFSGTNIFNNNTSATRGRGFIFQGSGDVKISIPKSYTMILYEQMDRTSAPTTVVSLANPIKYTLKDGYFYRILIRNATNPSANITETMGIEYRFPDTDLTGTIELIKPLNGKKIVFLGDSYTQPNDAYHATLAKRTGCVNLNYGVSSSRIAIDVTTDINRKSFITRFNELYAELGDTIDGVFVMGGINDANSIRTGNLTLGEVSDEVGAMTFFGRLKLLCENIINAYPGKRIMAAIPNRIQVWAASMQGWADNLILVQDAERKIYAEYGIPFVDLSAECFEMGTMPSVVEKYRLATNDIHPNQKGQTAIANSVEPRFVEIFKNNNI